MPYERKNSFQLSVISFQMMKRGILFFTLSVTTVILLTACRVTTPYQRPAQLPVNGLFRAFSDVDTTYAVATGSALDFYNDPLLQQLITEALDANPDVQQAIIHLAQLSELVKQRKAAFFPTLTFDLNGSVFDNSKYGNATKPANPFTELKLTATTGWEVDIWGKLSSLRRSQQAQYFQ